RLNPPTSRELPTPSLHDALPILDNAVTLFPQPLSPTRQTVSPALMVIETSSTARRLRSPAIKSSFRLLISSNGIVNSSCPRRVKDRKSTRLNSSHGSNSYAVFCL